VVLPAYGANLATILGALRRVYPGKLVLMTLYSPSPLFNAAVGALNDAMRAVAVDPRFNFHVDFADGFTAFQRASVRTGGDPCLAGLLILLPTTPRACDIHPSAIGQNLLAATVLLVTESGNQVGNNNNNNQNNNNEQ
jgi:hypothetical protein